MRIEDLRYLVEVKKHRSISAAAETLYLGQTTLRDIVKSVEEEVGFTIFHRIHRGVEVTPEGEEALALMEEISNLYQEILALDTADAAQALSVRVVVSRTINNVLAVPLTGRFFQQLPNGDLDFYVMSGREIGSFMIKEGANIGFTYLSDENFETYRMIAEKYQLEVCKLLRDRQYVLVSRRHPLAGQTHISYSAIRNLSFAMLPHYAQQEHSDYLKSFGPGNKYTVYDNFTLIKRAVLDQNMATILPGFCVASGADSELGRLKALIMTDAEGRERHETNLCLIHRQKQNLNMGERTLLRCISEYFDTLTIDPMKLENCEGVNLS